MSIQARIEQLEDRIKKINNAFDTKNYPFKDRFRLYDVKMKVEGQIDALKWVEAKKNRELSDFLKETRGWEKEPIDISPERIKDEIKSAGYPFYKPTDNTTGMED